MATIKIYIEVRIIKAAYSSRIAFVSITIFFLNTTNELMVHTRLSQSYFFLFLEKLTKIQQLGLFRLSVIVHRRSLLTGMLTTKSSAERRVPPRGRARHKAGTKLTRVDTIQFVLARRQFKHE